MFVCVCACVVRVRILKIYGELRPVFRCFQVVVFCEQFMAPTS